MSRGVKVPKLEKPKDDLDKFLNIMDDPNEWRKIPGFDIPLSRGELDILHRLRHGNMADLEIDPYSPAIDFFTYCMQQLPLRNGTEPKSRKLPSKHEGKLVMKLVHAIRKGWIKERDDDNQKPNYYALWTKDQDADDAITTGRIQAPKGALPGHRESYRPPPEYLASSESITRWKEKRDEAIRNNALFDPESKLAKYMPMSHEALRHISGYPYALNERFSRCLDLYLCTRVRKNKLQIDPDSLLPTLPDPKDLRPFPNQLLSAQYKISENENKSIPIVLCYDPTGEWLVTGSANGTVCLYDAFTGYCIQKWITSKDTLIQKISWNPNRSYSIVSVVAGDSVHMLTMPVANKEVLQTTKHYLINASTVAADLSKVTTIMKKSSSDSLIKKSWRVEKELDSREHVRLIIQSTKDLSSFSWHRKGDYCVAVCPSSISSSVIVHQLSKGSSQCPFKKIEGTMVQAEFHPSKPHLFLATARAVRVYDLTKQAIIKILEPGVKLISSLAVHPRHGDHVLVGSLDKQVSWFDMELSTKPYKTLRFHKGAVRSVSFHQSYPLFASCSDDGALHIAHGTIYDADMLKNPLIVPVKILRDSTISSFSSYIPPPTDLPSESSLLSTDIHSMQLQDTWTDCAFHPTLPWIVACGKKSIYGPSLFIATRY